ncbi:MAG: hypothetical protein IJT60_07985 [Clostridia bacterium]|nr:hypothetical protein [Clostridia bacterium]
MKKGFAIVLLLIFSLMLFCSCASHPKYNVQVDDEGRLTYEVAKYKGKTYEHIYQYDSEGRPVFVQIKTPDGESETIFVYSADGKTVTETIKRTTLEAEYYVGCNVLGMMLTPTSTTISNIPIVISADPSVSESLSSPYASFKELTVEGSVDLFELKIVSGISFVDEDGMYWVLKYDPDGKSDETNGGNWWDNLFGPTVTATPTIDQSDYFGVQDEEGILWRKVKDFSSVSPSTYVSLSPISSSNEVDEFQYGVTISPVKIVDCHFTTPYYNSDNLGLLFPNYRVELFDDSWDEGKAEFDSQGRLKSSRRDRSDGSWDTTVYTYEEKENELTVRIRSDSSDGSWRSETIKNDPSGNEIYNKVESSDESWTETISTFDSGNRLLTCHVTNSDGLSKDTIYRYDEYGNMVYEKHTDSTQESSNSEGEYAFDDQGRMIYEKNTRSDGEWTKTTYSFDADGKKISERTELSTGSWCDTTYRYKCDDDGVWWYACESTTSGSEDE